MTDEFIPFLEVMLIAIAHHWKLEWNSARKRVMRVQKSLEFASVGEAIIFLQEALPGSKMRVPERIVAIARNANLSPRAIVANDDGGSCRTAESVTATEVFHILQELPDEEQEPALAEAERRFAELTALPAVELK